MNHIRWAAWGVVDIEALDRQQRRIYIKRTRGQLAEKGIMLNCGGSTSQPWYDIRLPKVGNVEKSHTAGGPDAFQKVCMWLLQELGDHERSADGSVRGAGAEAQGS